MCPSLSVMRLACVIFVRNLVFAAANSSSGVTFTTMFETFLVCTILLRVLLCTSQNAMSEFAAFFRSYHFNWSRCIGINVSMLGASIQTCASAFSRILVILYLSLCLPYNLLFLWLQHALPHSMNVCAILERQYFLSGQQCLHLLAIFPMNRCSHPTLVCCCNANLYCCGIVSSYNNSDIVLSIVDPLGLPFHSSPLCVYPSSSANSIPISNRCRRWFSALISLIMCTNVSL